MRVALDSYLSVQFISVQFSFAITCLLHYNTHTHTHKQNLQPTTLPNNSSASSSLSKLLGQPTFLCRSNTKTKQQKPPSSCLADLTTPPALSSLVLPSPPRARSALSSFPFLSNETMQHLRLDFCYEPACLRSVFPPSRNFSIQVANPSSGPHCNTKPACVLQRHAHCFCNDDIDCRSK